MLGDGTILSSKRECNRALMDSGGVVKKHRFGSQLEWNSNRNRCHFTILIKVNIGGEMEKFHNGKFMLTAVECLYFLDIFPTILPKTKSFSFLQI